MHTSTSLRLALAQLDMVVGDVDGNCERVLRGASQARDELGADLVIFPELTLSGYPPEDLLFHAGFRRQIEASLARIREAISGIAVLLGYPEYEGEYGIYNSAVLLRDGDILAHYRKQCLPNYSVFDEKRYFDPGDEPCVVELKGIRLGITICEDIWEVAPSAQARRMGAQAIVAINGSPYELDYQKTREAVIRERVEETGVPFVYVNMVGGQDELVFDGGSLVMDARGELTQRAPPFDEGMFPAEIALVDGQVKPVPGEIVPLLPEEESVYRALVMGVRDYVDKHGFPGVVLGLSGGVDSALTLAVAVDALGRDRVQAVMMPSRYTAQMSLEDARKQAERLGVAYRVISIEGLFEAALGALADVFEGLPPDATEENIQSRCRGLILMALSNKTGWMLLTTGNKSEMAVGYATLYGDMAGGFAPIKDCSKTMVYRLARYRNGITPVIPERVLTREPSAELRPDQKDTDSLPPYDILDPILEAFIEDDLSVQQIAERGYERATVGRVLEMVKRNEYKRRQAPPGIRISGRAFGRDWRYPITSRYRFS